MSRVGRRRRVSAPALGFGISPKSHLLFFFHRTKRLWAHCMDWNSWFHTANLVFFRGHLQSECQHSRVVASNILVRNDRSASLYHWRAGCLWLCLPCRHSSSQSLAGLFGDAPSLALASLAITMHTNGRAYTLLDTRSMMAGTSTGWLLSPFWE